MECLCNYFLNSGVVSLTHKSLRAKLAMLPPTKVAVLLEKKMEEKNDRSRGQQFRQHVEEKTGMTLGSFLKWFLAALVLSGLFIYLGSSSVKETVDDGVMEWCKKHPKICTISIKAPTASGEAPETTEEKNKK